MICSHPCKSTRQLVVGKINAPLTIRVWTVNAKIRVPDAPETIRNNSQNQDKYKSKK